MSNVIHDIVAKLWNLCNVLKCRNLDGGKRNARGNQTEKGNRARLTPLCLCRASLSLFPDFIRATRLNLPSVPTLAFPRIAISLE